MTRRAVAPLVLTALVVVGARSGLQRAGIARRDSARSRRSRSSRGVEVVTVSAAVRDGRGRVVRDLKKADFEVHRHRRCARDSRLLRRRRADQPGGAARHQRQHGGRRQHGPRASGRRRGADATCADGRTKRRSSRSIRELAGSRRVHDGPRPGQARQPRGQAVGHDVALRRRSRQTAQAVASAPTGIARCSSSPTASTRAAA